MCYIWVSLRTWSVCQPQYNHIYNKKIINIQCWFNINIQNLQKETKYRNNDQKFETLKFGHLKTIFIHFMGLPGGHLM
jgi:hypothetical protein